ncbi:MAG: TIGR02757 family protein [Rikenellaceae bacterium]
MDIQIKCDKELLDTLVERYNIEEFIKDDPISIPHRYEKREDIEIAGFLASTIAWGNRKSIVKNGLRMAQLLDDEPYRFIMDSSEYEMQHLLDFVHRTFNGGDFVYFIRSLQNIYKNHGGIGVFFEEDFKKYGDMRITLANFHKLFFELEHEQRVRKHLSSIERGAACKRLNMYIKWMVRKDENGVDFGIWDIPSSALYLPLDVHTGNIGRQLGLLTRKQNDWKAVEEITASLREFDANDPVKYDYALFGAGVNGAIRNS